MVETLNELSQLRDSGFGRPRPRHGLKLLHWFANDCVSFDEVNHMLAECDPANGDFGFHHFVNVWNGEKLLLDENCTYYVVGNLNFKKYPKAKKLPKDVLENKNRNEPGSNTDRIIVSLRNRRFLGVYVTQHYNHSNSYDPDATYQISRGLLMIIRRKSLQDFLDKMGYKTHTQSITSQAVSPVSTVVRISLSDSSDSEPPADSGTQLLNNTPKQNNSESSPRTKGLWEKFCTIL